MDDRRFIEIISDRRLRTAKYREMVVGYYDRVTAAYRERWGESFHLPVFAGPTSLADGVAEVERRIAAALGFGSDQEVLDVGCGVGGPTLRLAELTGARVVGVNLVPMQVEIARSRAAAQRLADRVCFLVADAMALPFAESRFDAVAVFESGCHTPDKGAFYRECARVMKPGGLFVGVDWMMAVGTDAEDHHRFIDPVCILHGIPDLISVDAFAGHLSVAGFTAPTLENLTPWTGLTHEPVGAWTDAAPLLAVGLPPALALLELGGAALMRAAKAGAFVLCQWSARRA